MTTHTNHKYYSMLVDEAKQKFSKLAEDKSNLMKQIQQASAKLTDEKSRLSRVETQIIKLQNLCGEALATQNDYESYKVNLKKRIVEKETLATLIESFEKVVLPSLREKFSLANRALADALKIWTREKVKICEDAMTEKFQKHILEEEFDDFKESMSRLWGGFGESYQFGRSDTSPGLVHPRHSPTLWGHIADIPPKERVKKMVGEKAARRMEVSH